MLLTDNVFKHHIQARRKISQSLKCLAAIILLIIYFIERLANLINSATKSIFKWIESDITPSFQTIKFDLYMYPSEANSNS